MAGLFYFNQERNQLWFYLHYLRIDYITITKCIHIPKKYVIRCLLYTFTFAATKSITL